MSELVKLDRLTKYFDLGRGQRVHAVDGISFSIKEGETLGLVGESGSGKSTLGKTLLGLHDKTSGTLTYRGEVLPARYRSADFQRLAHKMQMVFQDPYSSLNPRMTVGEIIAEGLRGKPMSATQKQALVSQWLDRVGLNAAHASRYPHEFSGGQRQRIGIARALIMEPEFVVCDEPISALDVSVQAQVVNLLNDLKKSMGLTMLFIAHDLSMVRYISDRMAVMYLGSLVELGKAGEVYFEPRHPYTEVLIASNPEPDPATERQRVSTAIQGEIPSPVNVPEGCRFAGRCPKVMPVCHQQTPQLLPLVDEDRLVACHLYTR
ncbi:ABC transporter ATP-binding protein [Pseudohongiella sp.]|uniref:ABC transporter domain-containing protein n=1 Tax=marine sediment metagenome TaxID=412755 RepID=A0A0F9W7H4_9ZZZZ|nr:ABC transporter ATP-binding protein [Pseudohongiella sp.]HDZ09437.1 ABC transporter ATP-binding protein [Pseudohongiella sp.]HEA63954.1 ABC transporter ATP-binding protein [Pseudohongiella sp.]